MVSTRSRSGGERRRSELRSAWVFRFGSILPTSISIVAGLTVLLLEKSLQAAILILLASSLAFGVVAATIAALLLVLAAYCILDDFRLLGVMHEEDEQGAEGVPVS